MATRFATPYQQFFDSNGDPLASGTIDFFQTGTSTPLATYQEEALSTSNANPITLNSAGRIGVDVWLQAQDYKVVLKDSGGTQIWAADPVRGAVDADDIAYDNASSGLSATDVNAAIDEIDTTLDGYGTVVTRDTGTADGQVPLMDATGYPAADGSQITNVNVTGGHLTLETEQATTSGTAVDFTGIPSWVKRITVQIEGVSTNGTAALRIVIGDSGGFETSGYAGIADGPTQVNNSAAFLLTTSQAAAGSYHGTAVLTLKDAANNTWVINSAVGRSDATAAVTHGVGSKSLSGTLTQLRLTADGADTFDAGSVNILYE